MKEVELGYNYTINQWQVSDLIAKLEQVKKEHGDLLVCSQGGDVVEDNPFTVNIPTVGNRKILRIRS